MNYIEEITNYFECEKRTIDLISKKHLNDVMNVLVAARDAKKQIFIMGNGGSSATASHYVCDFNKGVSLGKEKKFKFICLNDNIPSLMAYGNDLSFSDVFVNQLQTYYNEGDVVIGISGSGNSENVIRAIEWANNNNGITIALTGFDGGKLLKMAKYSVFVPIDDMQITEDIHMILDHCMMKILSSLED